MNFRFFKDYKIFDVDVKRMNFFTQFIGLMFTSKNAKIRLFSYSKDSKIMIHSWFIYYPFLIIWLNRKKRIVGWKKVFPFNSCVVPPKKFRHFVEIPFNSSNKKILMNFLSKDELENI